MWDLPWTYRQWFNIEMLTLRHQRKLSILPAEAEPLLAAWRTRSPLFDDRTLSDISIEEDKTGHDVVAFLNWMRGQSGPAARFLHFGLTSSDLVDTTQGIRFRRARTLLNDAIFNLNAELTRWAIDGTPVLGRTHGQVAEPMFMQARGVHWMTLLSYPMRDCLASVKRLTVCKLSGPVGTFAHNPPEVEAGVAADLGLTPVGAGASQIVARSALAAWASSAAGIVEALAKIATDIRLMNMLGEASIPKKPEQVGSSAMPHKVNPIMAEQICGLAQMARGYALMLQPVAGWLERDIAHSSVERVAVPDLWHTLLHALKQTTLLLRHTKLDSWEIAEQYRKAGNKPLSSMNMLAAILTGDSTEEARRYAVESKDVAHPRDAGLLFMRNYPVKAYSEGQ